MRTTFIAIMIAAILSVATQPAFAGPLGSGFTYQGELQTSGAPANGNFDFEFELFNTATGGTVVGSTIFVNDVNVQNGIFSVELDFGSGTFSGEQIWINIAVRNGASTGGFTGLLPRQRITAAPYALNAKTVAVNAVGSNELADNSVNASKISSNAVGSSEIISSQVQQRVNGTCAAGTFANGITQNGSMNCAADQVGVDAAAVTTLIDANRVGTRIASLPFTITKAGGYYSYRQSDLQRQRGSD